MISCCCRHYHFGLIFKGWKVYEGKITKSAINKGMDVELRDVYISVIEYEFQVGTEKISASRLRFGIPTNSRGLSERLINFYFLGKSVEVLYDPKTRHSTLERGVTIGTHFLFLFGLLALSAAMVVIKSK